MSMVELGESDVTPIPTNQWKIASLAFSLENCQWALRWHLLLSWVQDLLDVHLTTNQIYI